jgi:hypothetical protein
VEDSRRSSFRTPVRSSENCVQAKFSIVTAQTTQDRRRGSHVPMNVPFLMYKSDRLALSYIRNAFAQDRVQPRKSRKSRAASPRRGEVAPRPHR